MTGDMVWCINDSDGYECSGIIGIFESREEAERIAAELQVKDDAEHKARMGRYVKRPASWSRNSRSFNVQQWQLGVLHGEIDL